MLPRLMPIAVTLFHGWRESSVVVVHHPPTSPAMVCSSLSLFLLLLHTPRSHGFLIALEQKPPIGECRDRALEPKLLPRLARNVHSYSNGGSLTVLPLDVDEGGRGGRGVHEAVLLHALQEQKRVDCCSCERGSLSLLKI